jgi:hypothetical protein
MANLKLEYLFRDESNYKKYGEVIFSNPSDIPLIVIQRLIKENLIEGSWFDPDKWMIPRFSCHRSSHFGINDSLWYEFVEIKEISNVDAIENNINSFIQCLIPDSYYVLGKVKVLRLFLLKKTKNTNFIYKVCGLSDHEHVISKFNSESKIKDRNSTILKSGGVFEFIGAENDVFYNNLVFIDSLLPGILAEVLIQYFTNGIVRLKEIIETLEKENPLKFNQTHKHQFYSYKIKRFLTNIASGMIPSKVWTGKYDTTGGYLVVKDDGDILCYHVYNRNDFENYLLNHTRLETASFSRHGFDEIYEEEGELFLKLNLQIRFIK